MQNRKSIFKNISVLITEDKIYFNIFDIFYLFYFLIKCCKLFYIVMLGICGYYRLASKHRRDGLLDKFINLIIKSTGLAKPTFGVERQALLIQKISVL